MCGRWQASDEDGGSFVIVKGRKCSYNSVLSLVLGLHLAEGLLTPELMDKAVMIAR